MLKAAIVEDDEDTILVTTLQVSAHHRPFTLIVEPWATEHPIAIGDKCQVTARHPTVTPTLGVEVYLNGNLMIWINEGGSIYEFWRNNVREFHTTVPIPF